jgi:hypothetical protein
MSRKLLIALALVLSPVAAPAADIPLHQEVVEPHGCLLAHRSPILDLPSAADMRAAVDQRLATSIAVATSERTIFNRSPRFVWASEAKAYCGMAVGYFDGGEVNETTVTKCDCFYERMQRFNQATR